MALRQTDPADPLREDGFGTRSFLSDRHLGRLERLDLVPTLSSRPSEQAIRARAAYLTNVADSPLARVVRISRNDEVLSVFTEAVDGVSLAELLAGLEFKTIAFSGEELLELAASVVTALAVAHERLPGVAHGALTPAHVVLKPDGTTMLTGAVYGEALQALQKNREHLWRDFGLALPTAASFPRFDQRSDVTQLGVLVLAMTQRRTLRRDEYPRGTHEMALSVTVTDLTSANSKLRLWLRDALQLHGRVVFASAVEAAQAFLDMLPPASERMLEALTLQTVIRQACGDTNGGTEALPHLRAS